MDDRKSKYVRNYAGPDDKYHIAPGGFKQSGGNMQEVVEIHPKPSSFVVQKQNEQESFALIEQVVMQGDLSKLNPEQRVMYYRKVCESMGLNPYTRPFDYILLNGKLTLYAKKDCTEQLRKINGVSIESLEDKFVDDLYIVKAFAKTKDGRTDASTGAVTIGHLKGEAKANAIMKAETKAKRRVTLSISGMGLVDETELESIPSAKRIDVDMTTGEITGSAPEIKSIPQVIKESPSVPIALSSDQVNELVEILRHCDEKYRKTVYDYVNHKYPNGLSGTPQDLYDRIKNGATENARECQDRLRQAAESLTLVTV